MYVYDETLPNKVIGFAEQYCRLSKAPYAGQPIKLLDYQRDIIRQLYGWRIEATGRLKHKTASIWLPKKNGKSSFCSAIALFNLLWTAGNEIYVIAPTIKQACCVFDECAAMAEQHPALKSRLWVRRNLKRIEDRKQYSKLEVLSCSPEISGFNAGLIILDEISEFPKSVARIVWDKIVNAGDAKPDSHKILISTAQFDKEHLGYEQYRLAKQVRNKEIDRPDILPVIFEVEEWEDWRSPDCQLRANPAANVLFPFSTIEDDYKTIQTSPVDEARFRTLRLNQWVGAADSFISSEVWAACSQDFDESSLYGLPAHIGIDYARKYDLCSYSIIVERDGLTYVLPRFFIPQAIADKKEKQDNVPYLRLWAKNPAAKLFLTPGDTVDPAFMRQQLLDDCKQFEVREIGFDPYGMEETRQILEFQHGLPMVEVSQTPANMSPGISHLERLVAQKKLRHNNPILTWNVGNTVVRTIGGSDAVMLDKRRSTGRIDGVTATCIALSRMIAAEQQQFYDCPVYY